MIGCRTPVPNQSAAHTALVRSALEELAIHGYTAWKNNTGAKKTESGAFIKYGKVGSADILLILPPWGRHIECEAKTGKAVQNNNQKIHGDLVVRRNGGAYIVFYNVPELLCALAEIEKMHPRQGGGWTF